MLLDRKKRKPANEEETEVGVGVRGVAIDPPRKRTDTSRPRLPTGGSLADGSPINPRKSYSTSYCGGGKTPRNRHSSLGGSPVESPRIFCSASARGAAPSLPKPQNQAAAAADALASFAATQRIVGSTSASEQRRQQQAIASSTSGSSVGSTAAPKPASNSYHYYTQPVDPLVLAAAYTARQGRISRRDQQQVHNSQFTSHIHMPRLIRLK